MLQVTAILIMLPVTVMPLIMLLVKEKVGGGGGGDVGYCQCYWHKQWLLLKVDLVKERGEGGGGGGEWRILPVLLTQTVAATKGWFSKEIAVQQVFGQQFVLLLIQRCVEVVLLITVSPPSHHSANTTHRLGPATHGLPALCSPANLKRLIFFKIIYIKKEEEEKDEKRCFFSGTVSTFSGSFPHPSSVLPPPPPPCTLLR